MECKQISFIYFSSFGFAKASYPQTVLEKQLETFSDAIQMMQTKKMKTTL